MGLLRLLSRRGDERVAWDLQHADVGDPEALAAILEAERLFHEARARGATAFWVERERPVERLERFDREAGQIMLVPRIVGG